MFNYQTASKKDIQTLVDLNLENLDTYDPRSKKQRDYLKNYLKETIGEAIKNYQVIYLDQTKIGYYCIELTEEGYEFVDFYLLPDYRHQGYGKQILQEILPAYPDLDLYVFTRNQIAIKLYQQFGFEEVEKISSSRIKMKKSA